VSHTPDNRKPAARRKVHRKSTKPPTFVPEFPIPRLDEYPVNYCPTYGLNLNGVHVSYQKLFTHLKTFVLLPEDVCHNCGLEYREMAIDLQSTREPTRKASEFLL